MVALEGNTGGPVSPNGSGVIDVLGGPLLTVTGTPPSNELEITLDDGTSGQLLIGGGGAGPAWANLTSTGGTITITPGVNTLNIESAGGFATTYTTNSGNASPAAGVLNVLGDHGINTEGAGNTVTIAINNAITLGDLTNITSGNNALTIETGDISLQATNDAGNVKLAATTATSGQITIGGDRYFHRFGSNTNLFAGSNSGNFTLTSSDNVVGLGVNAASSLTSGRDSVYIGSNSGAAITTGSNNVAIGYLALNQHPFSNSVVAIGWEALRSVTSASFGSTAVGSGALRSLTGANGNTALGNASLTSLLTGLGNTAIGHQSGLNLTGAEERNVYLGYQVIGVTGESNTIRIGTTQSQCFIAGIRGVTTGVADAINVLIDSNNQLGTVSSSLRYKQNIEDMGDQSEVIYQLRPVTFEYRKHPNIPQWGLIAEEVDKVFPQLVVYDQEDQPESIKYQDISVLLLNEIQNLRERIEMLENKESRCQHD